MWVLVLALPLMLSGLGQVCSFACLSFRRPADWPVDFQADQRTKYGMAVWCSEQQQEVIPILKAQQCHTTFSKGSSIGGYCAEEMRCLHMASAWEVALVPFAIVCFKGSGSTYITERFKART